MISFVFVSLLFGCLRAPTQSRQLGQDAIASLNQQIQEFNANKRSGTFPIDQRVSQIAFDRKKDQATCSDSDGKSFLVLNRQQDGRFKGILKVEYHLLGGSSSGHILAEFYLKKEMF